MGKLSKKISTIALSSTMLFGTVTIQATSIFTTGKYTIPYFSTIEIKYHAYDEDTLREEFIFWINENQYNVICLDNHNNTKTIMVTVSDVNKRSTKSYKFDTFQQDALEILREILYNSEMLQICNNNLLDKSISNSENSSTVGNSYSDSEKEYKEDQSKALQPPDSMKKTKPCEDKKISRTNTQLLNQEHTEHTRQINHQHSKILPWSVKCNTCTKPGKKGRDGKKHYHQRVTSKNTSISLQCIDCKAEKTYTCEKELIEEVKNGNVDFYCLGCNAYKDSMDLYGNILNGNNVSCGAGILCKTCRDRTMPRAQQN